MVYRPPWQKIARTPMHAICYEQRHCWYTCKLFSLLLFILLIKFADKLGELMFGRIKNLNTKALRGVCIKLWNVSQKNLNLTNQQMIATNAA